MIKNIVLFLLIFWLSWPLTAQLTINLVEVPSNTPLADNIYLAGNINNWNEADPNYIATNNGNQTYSITINPNPGLVEFKFTRGSWDSVEGNEGGGFQPNHEVNYSGSPMSIDLTILSWEDLGGTGSGPSTASDNVMVLDQDFFIPQLNRNRRIWIYLPPDYQNSNKEYPVLYLQDGQNVFDAYTSFSGEWEVDESLNDLFNQGDEGAIVVAIDNGGAERINEYSPWVHPTYGGGQGGLYAEFIVNTLKPYIDENYRTKPERTSTGIAGSSMGALITMYMAIEYQEVFGKVGIFSPAFWFSDQVYQHVNNTGKEEDMRFYLLAGIPEDNGSVVADLQSMYNTLAGAGFSTSELNIQTHEDGQHSEWYWAREFPAAYEWLCATQTTNTNNQTQEWDINVFPNPANELLFIHFKNKPASQHYYQFYTTSGHQLLDRPFYNDYVFISTYGLPNGIYWLNISNQERVIQSKRIVIDR